jgi:hypothetical protein
MMDILEDKKEIIKNNLEAGRLIKPKMYNNLLKKAQSGQILSKKELETFNELDSELRAIYTPEELAAQASDKTTNTGPENSPQGPPQPPAQPEDFENLHAVMQYLQKKGYKIQKSAIYNHKTTGKIRPNKEGKYLLKDVEKYAQAHLQLADGSPSPAKILDKAQKERAEAETRERIARATNWEVRTAALQQKLVPRDLFENELAARAAIFRTDGENFFRGQAPAIVNIVGGDVIKVPELIDFCLNALEQWLSRYLQREEFKVDVSAYEKIFEQAGKDESEEEDMDEGAA